MKKIHIVSHTHWDREWYKPFEFFRVKLVYVIDHLLELLDRDNSFRHFMLDGQTIILEDYLAIRPENRSGLGKYIESGRIGLGPWYVQPDEFAPDGESLVRNLLIGINQAREMGNSMMIGYLPDSFGHSSQMPQILKGFDINSAVVMRGVDGDKIESSEFIWKGLNGDEVLGVYLIEGYFNAMFLSNDNDISKLRINMLIKKLAPLASTDHLLVMNGIDHAFAQGQVSSLCGENEGWHQSSMEEYVTSVEKDRPDLKILEGELITPRHHRVHTSIASTRINQKIYNRKLSVELERITEPLCSIASVLGSDYPEGLLNMAWKTLIQNHTHDGICGCCTDEVHREMEHRFNKVEQISSTLIKNHSRAVSSRIGGGGLYLTVFNTPMTPGTRIIEAEVYVDDSFSLVDENGREVMFQVMKSEDVDISRYSIWTLYMGNSLPAKKHTILFQCEFKDVAGYRSFNIIPGKKKKSIKETNNEIGFENKYYRLRINSNGSVNLYDKETDFLYKQLNIFEDEGEGGDTYNHSPLLNDKAVSSEENTARIEIDENGPLRKVIRIELVLNIPASLNDDGISRSRNKLPLVIETRISMYLHTRRIDFAVTIKNNCLSHRLRALFPFYDLVTTSLAETQFGVLERENTLPPGSEGWPETPLPIYSMQRFSGLRNGKRSLFVINRGLPEYEVYQRNSSVLGITLHRGVSLMGRSELAIRPGRPSGLPVETPDAESPGVLSREYALLVGGNISMGELTARADIFATPSLAVQNRLDLSGISRENRKFFNNLSIDNLTSVISEKIIKLPAASKSFLKLGSTRLSVSAFKKAMNENSFILRLYNPGRESVTDEHLEIIFPHDKLIKVNLLEEGSDEIPGQGIYTLPDIKGNSQITLKILKGERV